MASSRPSLVSTPSIPNIQPFDSDEHNRLLLEQRAEKRRALTREITLRHAEIIDSTISSAISSTISSSGVARKVSHQRRPAGRRPGRRSTAARGSGRADHQLEVLPPLGGGR